MSKFNAPTYDIERPTGQCALTGRPLVVGEPYMATMVEVDPDDPAQAIAGLGFKRLDVCWEAWQSGQRPGRIFCHWKSTVAEANQKRRLFVDDDVLMNLFRRLADDEQPQRVAFRFVLGLILIRKKLLRYDGTVCRTGPDPAKQDGQQWWQVTPKLDLAKGPLGRWNDQDQLEMLDPHLDEDQIQEVTGQLGDVLAGEL